MNTQGEGVPVMIFNSLSWPRTEVTEIEAQLPGRQADSGGRFRTESRRSRNCCPSMRKLIALDSLLLSQTPSLGYATYFVRGATAAPAVHSMLKASADTLENEFLRLKSRSADRLHDQPVRQAQRTESLAPAETDTGGPKTRLAETCCKLSSTSPSNGTPGTSTPTSKSNTGISIRPMKSS